MTLAAACAWSGQLLAHPHVWLEAAVRLVIRDDKIVAIDQTWKFDEFFSAQMIGDFDANRDRKLDSTELSTLISQTQMALRQFAFFTHLQFGAERLRISEVENFQITEEKGVIAYRFRAKFPQALDPRGNAFSVGFFDESYFVDVSVDERTAVTVDGKLPDGCQLKTGERAAEPIYFGSIYPKLVKLTCHEK